MIFLGKMENNDRKITATKRRTKGGDSICTKGLIDAGTTEIAITARSENWEAFRDYIVESYQ